VYLVMYHYQLDSLQCSFLYAMSTGYCGLFFSLNLFF